MGDCSLYLGPDGVTKDLLMTVEFEERTEKIYFNDWTFSRRKKFSILYQSKEPPDCSSGAFKYVDTPVICSPTTISFCTKTTVSLSQCAAPIFTPKAKTKTRAICTRLIVQNQCTGLISFLLISMFSSPIIKINSPETKKSE